MIYRSSNIYFIQLISSYFPLNFKNLSYFSVIYKDTKQ